MKAICVVLAALLLALMTVSACAAGLSRLTGSGGVLPDPADLLGAKAFLYEEDVMEGGLPYVAFTFPMPGDYGRFLDQYTALAEAAGYEVSLDSETWLVSSVEGLTSNYRYDDIDPKSDDFATHELYTVKETDDGLLVEGCFNCTCDSGDTVFEDFVFSAVVRL